MGIYETMRHWNESSSNYWAFIEKKRKKTPKKKERKKMNESTGGMNEKKT